MNNKKKLNRLKKDVYKTLARYKLIYIKLKSPISNELQH